jgi:hypothetical protein
VTADHSSAERFLVEWYDPVLTAAPLPETAADLGAGAALARADGSIVSLDFLLAAPTDDVLYGVFTADGEGTVRLACRHAGWRPDRVTTGIRTHLTALPQPTKSTPVTAGTD